MIDCFEFLLKCPILRMRTIQEHVLKYTASLTEIHIIPFKCITDIFCSSYMVFILFQMKMLETDHNYYDITESFYLANPNKTIKASIPIMFLS